MCSVERNTQKYVWFKKLKNHQRAFKSDDLSINMALKVVQNLKKVRTTKKTSSPG